MKSELDPKRCLEMVTPKEPWGSFHQYQCRKKPWKDEYCKVHHPETVEARREASNRRWCLKLDNSPLALAYKKIEELEAEIKRLKEAT